MKKLILISAIIFSFNAFGGVSDGDTITVLAAGSDEPLDLHWQGLACLVLGFLVCPIVIINYLWRTWKERQVGGKKEGEPLPPSFRIWVGVIVGGFIFAAIVLLAIASSTTTN